MEDGRYIETSEFLIKGNLICWDGMMVQLSNISCISLSALNSPKFPTEIFQLLFYGIISFVFSSVFESQFLFWLFIVFLIIIFCLLLEWKSSYDEKDSMMNLILNLNSGCNLQFTFKDQQFLKNVIEILQEILLIGDIGKKVIYINISNNEITGDIDFLNSSNL